ncbi:zinc finger, CCHC-type containing protein [Tanacetum coccineum]
MSGKDDKKIEEGTSKIKEIGSTTHFQCPMLKGAKYTTWAIRMQVILEANGLWEMIKPNLTTEVDTKKDKTDIAYIYQSLPLPEEQLLLISKYKTTKKVWDALKKRHVGENHVKHAKQQTLKSKFEMLQMKENESIIACIEQYSDLDEMSVDEAIGRLKTFEERLKSKKEIRMDSQESLMFSQHEGHGKPFRERDPEINGKGDEIISGSPITIGLVGILLSHNGDSDNNHGDDGFRDVEGTVTKKAPHDVDTSVTRESKAVVTVVCHIFKRFGTLFLRR